eukprot:scaffold1364_cov116-Isochrysis_galbana.AAC.6
MRGSAAGRARGNGRGRARGGRGRGRGRGRGAAPSGAANDRGRMDLVYSRGEGRLGEETRQLAVRGRLIRIIRLAYAAWGGKWQDLPDDWGGVGYTHQSQRAMALTIIIY